MKKFENLKMLAITAIISITSICCKEDHSDDKATGKPETKIASAKENCDADFDMFFEKFSKDSIFQKQHVKFPLKNTYLNNESNYEKQLRYIKAESYSFSDFKKDETVVNMENGSYKVEIIKQKDSAFYHVRGIDNGIFTDVKFAFINGCWHMVAVEDSST